MEPFFKTMTRIVIFIHPLYCATLLEKGIAVMVVIHCVTHFVSNRASRSRFRDTASCGTYFESNIHLWTFELLMLISGVLTRAVGCLSVLFTGIQYSFLGGILRSHKESESVTAAFLLLSVACALQLGEPSSCTSCCVQPAIEFTASWIEATQARFSCVSPL